MSDDPQSELRPRHTGALRPAELAEAAVLGDIALVFEVLGWFLPFGGALQVLAIVPIALLATRHRVRAAVVATFAIAGAGFIIGGLGLVIQVVLFGSLGISIGVARRRGGGIGLAVLLGTLTTGIPAALLSLGLSAIFPNLRQLLLAQVNIYGKGLARFLSDFGLHSLASHIVSSLGWINSHWYLSYPSFEVVAIALMAGLASRYLHPLIDRLQRDGVPPHRDGLLGDAGDHAAVGGTDRPEPEAVTVAPVPARLENVSYRYPGADVDAVSEVQLEVRPAELTLLVGRNGSGKSTVARLLAGLAPSSGRVVRPGRAGLGQHGGTAMVFQRPECQVLGVRVRDDVVWGLPESVPCDVAELLGRVGLAGMEERETSTLSGGELQRLAIAAALARAPQLVISDESTSMLDTEGQRSVDRLLGDLAEAGVAVVHSTHRLADGARASHVVTLAPSRQLPDSAAAGALATLPSSPLPDSAANGALVTVPGGPLADSLSAGLPGGPLADSLSAGAPASPLADSLSAGAPASPLADSLSAGAPSSQFPDSVAAGALPGALGRRDAERPPAAGVSLRGVGHVYADGTPWAHRAIGGIDLTIEPGEAVVITGPNGSGKSTLAWVISGLVVPSEGTALVGGAKASERLGEIGIGFQHARLQLIRPTVLADAAYGVDEERARQALRSVSLDPDLMGARRVDALSGGEQRRVALAGILARDPVLVVLDEPLAGLDEDTRLTLEQALGELRAQAGVATVVIAHDLEAAAGLGDRLVTMARGSIVADGPMPVAAKR